MRAAVEDVKANGSCPTCQLPAIPLTVTVPQAMRLTGKSRRTIYNWVTAGKLDITHDHNGYIRIKRDEWLVYHVAQKGRPCVSL